MPELEIENPDAPTAFEIKAAVDELNRAFEEQKAAQDEAGASADPLIHERIEALSSEVGRLQKSLDALNRRAGRPAIAGETADAYAENEQKSAFYDGYVRKGFETGLANLEAKALQTGVNADGGFTVPEALDREIDRLLKDISPIRDVAKVAQIGTSKYKKLVTVSGTASGWVSETAARVETDTPTFAEIAPPLGEIYANPAATQAMLDDSFFDVEAWLAEELAIEFGAQEGAAFVNGDGINKPKGFLTYPTATTADGVRPFGTLQHISTGVIGDFPVSDPSDILIDLVHSLKPVYRHDAVFVMNTNTVARIRKFKDVDGNYLWRPGLSDGTAATLLGYPVVEAEDMPDIGAGTRSIAFGNFGRGYTVTDRFGTRILRDPFSNKPFVHFYATKRTGGGVVNSEAIKIIEF